MDEIPRLQENQRRLLDSREYIIPFSKALSHPQRYKILVFLLNKPKSFNELKTYLNIGRTAIANHLNQLLEINLVSKPERGLYQITGQGEDFLKLLLDFYNKIKVWELNQARVLQNKYRKSFQPKEDRNSIMVSNPAHYNHAWLSFLAAFLGVLKSLGGPWQIEDLSVYTGYAFHTNVANDLLCPSAPTVGRVYFWKSMVQSIEQLGFKIDFYMDEGSYPSENHDDTVDQLRALKFKNWVNDGLATTDRPVIAWGIPIPEFGIINGIEDNYYICSTFRKSVQMEENPVHYMKLQAPGCLWGYQIAEITTKEFVHSRKEWDYHALKQGISFFTKYSPVQGYTLGIDAYEVWARNLEAKAETESDYHGNSYVGECTLEQKSHLTKFLAKMYDRYHHERFGSDLKNALKEYSQITDLMRKFRDIFPFSLKGSFSEIDKRKGAAILRSIPPFEQAAISALEEVVKKMEHKN